MHLSLLQFCIIISAIVFFLFGVDLFKRKKANFLHFVVFIGWSIVLVLFALNQSILDKFWEFFWLARWADLIVYGSIIVLAYFYITLLNNINRQDMRYTQLVREVSINDGARWNLWDVDTVFIIPAYNEKDVPIKLVGDILDSKYGVILIDDGKNENLVDKLHTKYWWKNLVTIKHVINLWQWAWLETGAEYIRRFWKNIKYVVHFDADWQHRLQDLVEFQKAYKEDPSLEIVLWSRFLWSSVNMPKSKKLALKLWIVFTFIFSGIKLTDTHNWYRMMKKESLDKIHISMNQMEHASEILDIIKRKKMKYKEVPITVIYSDYAIAKWQKVSNAAKIVKNLLYKKIFFR